MRKTTEKEVITTKLINSIYCDECKKIITSSECGVYTVIKNCIICKGDFHMRSECSGKIYFIKKIGEYVNICKECYKIIKSKDL